MQTTKSILLIFSLILCSPSWARKVQLDPLESSIMNFAVFYMTGGTLRSQWDQTSRENLHYGRALNVVCELETQTCRGKNGLHPKMTIGPDDHLRTYPNFLPGMRESAWIISLIQKYGPETANDGFARVRIIDCEELPEPNPSIRNPHSCVMSF